MLLALKILVIEDNDSLRQATVRFLSEHEHQVVGVVSAEDVGGALADFSPDVYIIDVNLPGEDGVSLSRRIRQQQPNAGILMTTARSEVSDRVAGYENGADVYLPKPVDPDELVACLQALGKRVKSDLGLKQTQKQSQVKLSLSVKAMQLLGPLGSANLTMVEVRLLLALVGSVGQQLGRWQIAETMGKNEDMLTRSSLEQRMARIRRKLMDVGASAPALKAVHNIGYALCTNLELRE